jgi:probable HAF family extracellular repeat protein
MYTTIDPPGTVFTNAFGINDRGQIVGGYFNADSNEHGFLLRGGQYTTIDEPNAGPCGETEADGINARGQIVGWFLDGNGNSHAFLLNHGQYTTLDDPNAVFGTIGQGINARGQIVGWYRGGDNHPQGFLLSGGQYTTLDVPNARWTLPTGINDSGEIVGVYFDAHLHFHGFLATPEQDDPASAPVAMTSASNAAAEIVIGANALLTNALPSHDPSSAAAGGSAAMTGDGSDVSARGDHGTDPLVPNTPAGMQAARVGNDGGSAELAALEALSEKDVLGFDPWNGSPAARLGR